MNREELFIYLQQFLQPDQFKDYCPNGLQVSGKQQIKKIVTGVSACQALIDAAIAAKADTLLVHHGFFWKGEEPALTGIKRQRIASLLQHDINLFAYHLPLDAHPEVGNNVQLAKLFNFQEVLFLDGPYGHNIGCQGLLLEAQTPQQFAKTIATVLKREPQVVVAGNKPIKTIAWCTGAAQDYLEYVADLGVDAYLSGEISERTYHQAQELGVHYFAAGHHATERYGIKALGEHLAHRFHIDVEFIDIDNPV